MKTIETKIAKNGAVNTYVNGKKMAIAKAAEFALEEKIQGEKNIAIINENGETYQVSAWETSFIYRDNDVKELAERIKKFARGEIKSNATVETNTEAEIDDYAVTIEAQDAAVDAEIELAANTVAEDEISGYDETAFDLLPIITDEEEELRDYLYDFDEKQEVLADKYEIKNPPPAPEATGTDDKIAALERSIANVIAERSEAYDELANAEADDETPQWFIDDLKWQIDKLLDEYWELVRELESLQKTLDSEKKFLADVCRESEVGNRVIKSKMFATAAEAANWIISFAPEFKICDGTQIKDFSQNKIYRMTEADFAAVNPATETPNETPDDEEITFIAQNGASLTIEGGMPTITANGNKLEVNGICLGEYYTNEDAQIAAETLKYDVEEFGDDHPVLHKFYFAECEFEESPTGGERTAELEEMREEIQRTPPISKERLKTLDEMINQVKRDIYETETDNPDTIESFCKAGAIDENGDIWF